MFKIWLTWVAEVAAILLCMAEEKRELQAAVRLHSKIIEVGVTGDKVEQ